MKSEIVRLGSRVLGLLLAGGLLFSSGCATVPKGDSMSSPPMETSLRGDDLYGVEIHPPMGEKIRWTGKATEGLTVQQALEASGALKKVRVPTIDLVRKVEGQPLPLRMQSEFDTKTRRVSYQEDYAIHPGDRLIVRPKQSPNPIEKLFGK